MNADDFIELIVGLTAFISFIYRISQLESKIYQKINSVEDKLTERVIQQENDFAIHLSTYSAKKEWQDYRIHGLDEKIIHKFDRCWDEIKLLKNKKDN